MKISTGTEMTHVRIVSQALLVSNVFPNIKILCVKYAIHTGTTGSWFEP